MKAALATVGVAALVAATPTVAAAPADGPTDRIAALVACTQRVYEDGSVVHIDVDPDWAGGPAMTPRCARWVGRYVGGGGYGRDRQRVLDRIGTR